MGSHLKLLALLSPLLVAGVAHAQTAPPSDADGNAPQVQPYPYPQQPVYPYPQQPIYPNPQLPAYPYAPPATYYPPPRQRPPAWVQQPTYAQPPVVRRSTDPYAFRRVRGYFGFSGLGSFVLNQTGGAELLDHGGGWSLFTGVDLGHVVGLELSYTGSYHNPATLCGADYYAYTCDVNYLTLDLVSASLRLRIPTHSMVQPYFQGGGSVAWIGRQGYAADATGGGFEAGGGLDLWLGNWFSFGPRVLYRGLWMSDYATFTGGDTYLSILTADLNMALRF